MLLLIYKNKDGYPFKKIKSHYTIRQQSGLGGGVCDMTLLEFFHYHSEYGGGPGRVGEMMSIINESTYDHNINAEDNDYDFVNNVKHGIGKMMYNRKGEYFGNFLILLPPKSSYDIFGVFKNIY
jgi:hypothetical protein